MGQFLDEVVEVGLHAPENFLVAMADRAGVLRGVRTMTGPVNRLAHAHRELGRRRDRRHDRHDTEGRDRNEWKNVDAQAIESEPAGHRFPTCDDDERIVAAVRDHGHDGHARTKREAHEAGATVEVDPVTLGPGAIVLRVAAGIHDDEVAVGEQAGPVLVVRRHGADPPGQRSEPGDRKRKSNPSEYRGSQARVHATNAAAVPRSPA